ncbi:sporulation protein YunB [Pullulanibacillus camelliae]|nr:sporulation protein YunB [Pullulanibacillus camelliae]
MKLKRSKTPVKLGRYHIFIISLVIFLVMNVLGVIILSESIKPALMELAQTEAEQAVIYAVNYGLSDRTLKEMRHDVDFSKENIITNEDRFIHKSFDKDGEPQIITFNGLEIQQFITRRTEKIQHFLRLIENGKISISHDEDSIIKFNKKPVGISTQVPIGSVTKINLLNNLGPNIPIHFEVMNNVETKLKQKIDRVGINSSHIQLSVQVRVRVRVVMPFMTKATWIDHPFPVVEETVRGKIPKNYQDK